MIRDGEVHRDAALLLLFQHRPAVPHLQMRLFRADRDQDGGDRGRHRNGASCASSTPSRRRRNTRASGRRRSRASSTPSSFASHPVLVGVGGAILRPLDPEGERRRLAELLLRHRRGAGADGGQAARPLREHARAAFARMEAELGAVSLYIGFDCVLRRLDAEREQIAHDLSELYRRATASSASTPMASSTARCTSTRPLPASRSAVARRGRRDDMRVERDRQRAASARSPSSKKINARADVARRALGGQPVQRLFAVRDRDRARPPGAPPHPGIAAGDALDRARQQALRAKRRPRRPARSNRRS